MAKKEETAHEKFLRLGEARTQKIIDMIRLLGNCSNPYIYEYSKKNLVRLVLHQISSL